MTITQIEIFRGKNIRKTIYKNEWWFSVIDIIQSLTETERPRKYWSDLKTKLIKEGYSELSDFIGQLKLVSSDGKKYLTDCANIETIFRIIQTIPSPKVEPMKRWLAKVGYERIQEIEDPELATKRTRFLYKAKGYPVANSLHNLLKIIYTMGIVKPPWISESWFQTCPFNYCDHFGDKKELALMCKICKDEVVRIKEYESRGEDPYDLKNVFKEVHDSFAVTMEMIKKDAKRLGIDLDSLPDEDYPEPPSPEHYSIYRLIRQYSDQVGRITKDAEYVPVETDTGMVVKAFDVLAHSRMFVMAKTARALSSLWHERRDKFDDAMDSKTSAFMAYMAVERNSKALTSLAVHGPMRLSRKKFLKMSKLSLDIMELIQAKFFPEFDPVVYGEFGCKSYDKLFGRLGESPI